jgi:predicted dehydrogenase
VGDAATESMMELAVGLVGLGRFGRLHARTLQQIPGCRLAALCDAEESALEAARTGFGIKGLYENLDEMLDSQRLDVLDVVSDEASHAQHVAAGLEAGLSVFVEKPLATSASEADRLLETSRRSRRIVMVGNISRFDARYAVLRDELERGAFGRVVLVRTKRNFSRHWFSDFGGRVHPVYESMIHDLDLVLWYMPGTVTDVFARQVCSGGGDDVPDAFVATLGTADGAIASLCSTWLVPSSAPLNLVEPPAGALELRGTIDAHIDVVGTDLTAHVSLLDSGVQLWSDEALLAPDAGLWPQVHGRVGGALFFEMSHFLDGVRNERPSPVAPLEDSVAAVHLAEAIISSAESGRLLTLEGVP